MTSSNARPRNSTSRARPTKSRRIALRLTPELGERLDLAVAMSGRSQSDLVTEAIAEKASEIVRERRLLELTDYDMDALLEAIDHPPQPNEAMRRSIARWRKFRMSA